MSKDKKAPEKVIEKPAKKEGLKEVTIIKKHPLCGNSVGEVCELPTAFAEMLIAENFAK